MKKVSLSQGFLSKFRVAIGKVGRSETAAKLLFSFIEILSKST